MKDKRVTVFEVVNHTRKEIYVGMTAEGIHQVIARQRSSSPSEIAHWKLEDVMDVCSLEFNLAASRAEEFVAAHVLKAARPGWKIFAGRSSD